uniref:Uncharacterized protein n=1 Tax=Glossina brevipalpis TaxID=37001 RepID=A0A1A9WHR6_9MUSC
MTTTKTVATTLKWHRGMSGGGGGGEWGHLYTCQTQRRLWCLLSLPPLPSSSRLSLSSSSPSISGIVLVLYSNIWYSVYSIWYIVYHIESLWYTVIGIQYRSENSMRNFCCPIINYGGINGFAENFMELMS